jgi:[protein-PII] uridylyltransferase
MRRSLLRLLGAGSAAIAVLEALDQKGLLERALPEWAAVRSRPQRNAYHRFTVDRHLCEAAAGAARLAVRVRRPDLLIMGAWLHDIGKGFVPERGADHTVAGIAVVDEVARRMGFCDADVAVLVDLVRHHLLLPDVATRRDVSDPTTVKSVAAAVADPDTVGLLAALTEADSLATGPAAWSGWKAGLVGELADRAVRALNGGSPDADPARPGPHHRALAERARATGLAVEGDGASVAVAAPDHPGLFCRIAGALTLHNLEVLDARAWSHEGTAMDDFTVSPTFGGAPDWAAFERSLRLALEDRLPLADRVAERARQYAGRYRGPVAAAPARTSVLVDNEASEAATVVEVRAPDGIGTLYRITRALAGLGLDIRSAKVATLGHEVVDSFYVVDGSGAKLAGDGDVSRIETAIRAELEAPDRR